MTTKKSAPAAGNGEGADNTEARTSKDTASTTGEQADEQMKDDGSKTEQTPAASEKAQAEPASEEEEKKDITQLYPESLRSMKCDDVSQGFVMFDDHLSELMLDAVRLHCASPRVTWGRPGTGTLISKISKVHWTWWRLRVKKTMTAGMVSSLSAILVAEVIRQLRTVRIIEWAGMERAHDDSSGSGSFLAVYDEERGVYVLCDSDEDIARLARHIEPGLSGKDVIEVRSQLMSHAERVVECSDPNLVPMANGVLDLTTKELLPHSPERAFLHAYQVDWVPGTGAAIGDSWG